MHQQPVAKLRLEPRGLRRHDAAGVGDRHQVGDTHRIERERDRGLARVTSRSSSPARGCRRRNRCACRSARRRSSGPARAPVCCRTRRPASFARGVPGAASAAQRVPAPREEHRDHALASGAGARGGRRFHARDRADQRVRRFARQVLHDAVVRQDADVVVRKRDGEELGRRRPVSRRPRRISRSRARRWPRDGGRRRCTARDARERVHERARVLAGRRARSCAARRRAP